MKKLFLVLAVASLGFVACNNETETKSETTDSTKNVIDSVGDAAKDAVNTTVDSAKAVIDSTVKAVDTTKK